MYFLLFIGVTAIIGVIAITIFFILNFTHSDASQKGIRPREFDISIVLALLVGAPVGCIVLGFCPGIVVAFSAGDVTGFFLCAVLGAVLGGVFVFNISLRNYTGDHLQSSFSEDNKYKKLKNDEKAKRS